MPRKCSITGKFMSKTQCLKCDVLMSIRSQTILVAGLLAVLATTCSVYI